MMQTQKSNDGASKSTGMSDQGSEAASIGGQGQSQTPGVLIVEDEPRLREMLTRALPDMGFVPRTARNGEEALKMMETESTPIAILDLHLPGISGIDLFKKIRERWPETAVIILTGYGDLATAKAAIHLDVVDFLSKPCPLGEIEVALDRARRRVSPRGKMRSLETEQTESGPVSAPEKTGKTTLDEAERTLILEALKRHKGNRNATAAELDISIRTLYYRLAEYEKLGFEVEG